MIRHALPGKGAYKDMARKAMKILALDTALNACSVAVVKDRTVLAHQHEKRSRGHAETLLPMIQGLIKQANVSFDELDLIAVSVGPGTFTGLRIGLAAARGISLASSTPCIGVTTLEALAASISREQSIGRPIVVASDARRQELYFQTFDYQERVDYPVPQQPAKAIPLDHVHEHLPHTSCVVLGNGAGLLKEACPSQSKLMNILDVDPDPDARIIASIARLKGLPPAGSPPPSPVYLRAPDAKLPGGITPNAQKPNGP